MGSAGTGAAAPLILVFKFLACSEATDFTHPPTLVHACCHGHSVRSLREASPGRRVEVLITCSSPVRRSVGTFVRFSRLIGHKVSRILTGTHADAEDRMSYDREDGPDRQAQRAEKKAAAAAEKAAARITTQFRERQNITYEFDCNGSPLVLRMFPDE